MHSALLINVFSIKLWHDVILNVYILSIVMLSVLIQDAKMLSIITQCVIMMLSGIVQCLIDECVQYQNIECNAY